MELYVTHLLLICHALLSLTTSSFLPQVLANINVVGDQKNYFPAPQAQVSYTPPAQGSGGGHATPTPTTPSGGGGGGSRSYGGTPPSSGSGSRSSGRTPPSGGGGSASYGGTPPSNCGQPPRSGSGNRRGTPSSPSGGGYYYSPPTSTPLPTPTAPIVTPTPTTPIVTPTPTTPIVTPTPTTPITYPGTPSSTPGPGITTPSPPFSFGPVTPPFTCVFWMNNPALVWGLIGWLGTVGGGGVPTPGGTLGGTFGVPAMPGSSGSMNLVQALSNTRGDGYGALYREGTAAFLNSIPPSKFPYTTAQVREGFVAALRSNKAAADKARVFKQANEGIIRPAKS